MKQRLRHLVLGTQGQDLIEYSLLAALISIAGVLLLPPLGTAVRNIFWMVQMLGFY